MEFARVLDIHEFRYSTRCPRWERDRTPWSSAFVRYPKGLEEHCISQPRIFHSYNPGHPAFLPDRADAMACRGRLARKNFGWQLKRPKGPRGATILEIQGKQERGRPKSALPNLPQTVRVRSHPRYFDTAISASCGYSP